MQLLGQLHSLSSYVSINTHATKVIDVRGSNGCFVVGQILIVPEEGYSVSSVPRIIFLIRSNLAVQKMVGLLPLAGLAGRALQAIR